MAYGASRYALLMCYYTRTFAKMYDIVGECLDDGLTHLRLLTRMLRRAKMHGKGVAGSREWKRYRRELKRLRPKPGGGE